MNKISIQNLVKDYSIETTVREARRMERFSGLIPAGTRLYIPHTPGTHFQDTVALATRLRKEGMEPVPHVVARRIDSLSMLDDFLGRLAGYAGVKQVLIVAGDTAPVGQLDNTLQVLESGVLEKHQIKTVGVAGHPEGHPYVGEAVLREALRRKNAYARRSGANVYIVTQFTFAPAPIVAWEESQRADIGQLPVTVGIPGLASTRTLLKYALDCGVGASIQAFSRRASSLTKLLTISTPDDIIVRLADHKEQNPQSRLTSVHFFPFGGFKRTADWVNSIVAGSFELTSSGGLIVTTGALM